MLIIFKNLINTFNITFIFESFQVLFSYPGKGKGKYFQVTLYEHHFKSVLNMNIYLSI